MIYFIGDVLNMLKVKKKYLFYVSQSKKKFYKNLIISYIVVRVVKMYK